MSNASFRFQSRPERHPIHPTGSMEGRPVPRILQQLAVAHARHTSSPVADDGVGHDRELGEEGRRQAQRR